MKLATANAPVEVSGSTASGNFTIAMNGKAFKVLSDTLYQNKIGSIVREVSCNAFDAHVMAGKPELPFIIHLPDAFEPWFSVQDYGVGLGPEDIESVFTVYFQSTKDNSNDAVGAFGLGAKTPFSYTDQFTVSTVKNGMRRQYSAYITESGVPAIAEMFAEETTDPNGVEIKLSVKREDYSKFANEVASQLKFFTVKPTIVNNKSFRFEEISNDLALKTANVAISNNGPGYGQQGFYVIQGNVGYPLDLNQVKEKMSPDNARLLNGLSGSAVRFYFNIGEIGVTASREGVEYNKHTLANIEAKLSVVGKELTDYINTKLAGFATGYEKAEFLNSNPALNRLARGANITIPGIKHNNSYQYYFDFDSILTDPTKKNPYGNAEKIGHVKVWIPGRAARDATEPTLYAGKHSGMFTEIILRDTANKPNIRAKFYMQKVGNNTRLMEIDMYGEFDYSDAFIAKLSALLGGYTKITRLSEIEPPAKETVDKTGKVRAAYTRPTHYTYNSGSGNNIRGWDRAFEPLDENDEDTLYVEIEDMDCSEADNTFINQYALYAAFSKKVPSLVGIRKPDLKKIANSPNYVSLEAFITKEKKRIAGNKRQYNRWRHAVLGGMLHSAVPSYLMRPEILDALKEHAANSPATKALAMADRLSKTLYDSNSNLSTVARFMGWDETKVRSESRQKKIKVAYENLMKRYPFLKVYSEWQVRGNVPVEHLAKYLAAM